ncbi:Uncharacterized conserved protein, DUF1499 family [Malonomonas rubra DSM 5091]|uniref:Uncharacterized conserved protein, DUF1499 family n=1 Tax=Malonomonas rubra DSM 5091 TaxID=1122189 RepID=A0A1M6JZH2_MALRU|nr:DUF1499 domain-containing protein [Malonomonas rubra]SHJ52048.1 Uncharacterized conserved protein, DUF1499 family [Malonomonas rubra DSM 5091]
MLRYSRGYKTMTILSCLFLAACVGKPTDIGVHSGKLADCPSSPNCVSSDAQDANHHTKPFQLNSSPEEAWEQIRLEVENLPGSKIVTAERNYLHAECRSKVFKFVDDLELHLRPEKKIVAVRSAARLGYSDFGVNRKRIEQLRSTLLQQGIIESD